MPVDDTESFEIQVNTPPATARIQKLSICWSGRIHNTGVPAFIANHFDMCSIDNSSIDHATYMKTVNPNIKVLGYWDIEWEGQGNTNPLEAWYVHATTYNYPPASSSNRIDQTSWPGNYLMNVSNSGWSNYFATRCLNGCTGSYSVYDGFFIDDVLYNMGEYSMVIAGTTTSVNKTTDIEDAVYANWNAGMNSAITNLKNTLPSTKFILSNIGYSSSIPTIGVVTGFPIYEGFLHASWRPYNDDQWTPTMIHTCISNFRLASNAGVLIAVVPEVANANSHDDYNVMWMRIAYACFSFAIGDVTPTNPNPTNKAYFAHNFYGQDTHNGWYPEMDYVLGNPLAPYYQVTGNIYAREFENYYVLANLGMLGTTGVTFTFKGISYTLIGKEAEFIQK